MKMRHGLAMAALLVLAACKDPPPLPMDFVRALAECPRRETNCVSLIGYFTEASYWASIHAGDKTDASIEAGYGGGADVRVSTIGRLNGGHLRRLELRYKGSEDIILGEYVATFAALGPHTILTTHGPIEVMPNSLTLGGDTGFLLIDTRDGSVRRHAGPSFWWRPPPGEEFFGRFRPAFAGDGEIVWLLGEKCLRLNGSARFATLPRGSCRAFQLEKIDDDSSMAHFGALERAGIGDDVTDGPFLRIVGTPYVMRFEFVEANT